MTTLEQLYASKGVLTDDVKRVLEARAQDEAKRRAKVQDDNFDFTKKLQERIVKDPKGTEAVAKDLLKKYKEDQSEALDDLIAAMPLPTPEQLAMPRFWGRARWGGLTATAFAFPRKPTKKQIDAACAEVKAMKYTLPCGKCRKHWRENLKKHPLRPVLEAEGGPGFRKWVVDRHNDVNKDNKKPEMAFGHVCKMYDPDGHVYKIVAIVLGVALALATVALVVVAARLSAYVSSYGCPNRLPSNRNGAGGSFTPTPVLVQ